MVQLVLKEAALSGGSYLGCLQSIKKKTEAPLGLAFSFLLALHGDRNVINALARYLRSYYAYAALRVGYENDTYCPLELRSI